MVKLFYLTVRYCLYRRYDTVPLILQKWAEFVYNYGEKSLYVHIDSVFLYILFGSSHTVHRSL